MRRRCRSLSRLVRRPPDLLVAVMCRASKPARITAAHRFRQFLRTHARAAEQRHPQAIAWRRFDAEEVVLRMHRLMLVTTAHRTFPDQLIGIHAQNQTRRMNMGHRNSRVSAGRTPWTVAHNLSTPQVAGGGFLSRRSTRIGPCRCAIAPGSSTAMALNAGRSAAPTTSNPLTWPLETRCRDQRMRETALEPQRKSAAITREALCPGAPVTPPPGWVPAPHRYRPGKAPR